MIRPAGESSSLVASVFQMTSRLGYLVPSFNIRYDESNTGKSWFVSSGATRCYLARGEAGHTIDLSEQAADSHFLMSRIVAARTVRARARARHGVLLGCNDYIIGSKL